MSEHITKCSCNHEPLDHEDAEGSCTRCRCFLLRINRWTAFSLDYRKPERDGRRGDWFPDRGKAVESE